MIRVGVIGCGYWGPNLVRNFQEFEGSEVVGCADLDPSRLRFICGKYPHLRVTENYLELIEDPSVDAVAVVTPVSTHHRIAREALVGGKHVLVEKPLAASTCEAEELVRLSAETGRVLMVGHTFLYTGAVEKIKEIVDSGELGDLLYLDSVRVNLGLFQSDTNVLWDLAPHDLSIIDHLVGKPALSVSALGACHVEEGLENIAYLTVRYEDNIIAHVHVNWLAPTKVRKTLIAGTRKMIVYDDLEPDQKVKVYDKGVTRNGNRENIYRALVEYRMGDMWAPKLSNHEALAREVAHFCRCIQTGEEPMTGGVEGSRIVQILEKAQKSMGEEGRSQLLATHKCSPRLVSQC